MSRTKKYIIKDEVLEKYLGPGGDVVISNIVTSIGESAFKGNFTVMSVVIPDSVTSIGNYAFSGCSSLKSVTIPSSITSIGHSAFSGCSSLKSVTIPSSVTSIADWAFDGCSSLTSVTIPDSVTSIGSQAFANCNSLTSVAIPDSVISMGNDAFGGCSNLTSVEFPSSVTSINWRAFSNCSNLTSVVIPGSATKIVSWAFNDFKNLKSLTVSHWTPAIEKLKLPYECVISCTEDRITAIPPERRPQAAMGFALIPDKDMASYWAKANLDYIEKYSNELVDAAFNETELLKLMCEYRLIPEKYLDAYLARAKWRKDEDIEEMLLDYKGKIIADLIERETIQKGYEGNTPNIKTEKGQVSQTNAGVTESMEVEESENAKEQISKGAKKKIIIALSVAALLIIIFLAATSTYRTLNKEVQSESAAVGLENVTVSAWTEHHSAGDYHFTFNYYNINCSNFDMYSIEEKINVFNAVRGVTINSKTTYLLNNIISNGNTYSYDSSKRRLYKNGSVIYDDYLNSQAYTEYLKNHPEEDPSLRKVTCEMCKGSGKVRYYYGESALEAFLDGYPDYEYGPCPNCEGKGYFFEKK